jgi:hypothetical protein
VFAHHSAVAALGLAVLTHLSAPARELTPAD